MFDRLKTFWRSLRTWWRRLSCTHPLRHHRLVPSSEGRVDWSKRRCKRCGMVWMVRS